MIKSMTGFGKGEATIGTKKITVEIRSLNSKQMDLSVKIPSLYRPAEYEIRNAVARSVVRGKTDLFISVEDTAAGQGTQIDTEAFARYMGQLRGLLGQPGDAPGSGSLTEVLLAQSVLRLPDVMATQSAEATPEELAALHGAVAQALQRLDEFRLQEGATLIADLLRRVELIRSYKEAVTPHEKARVESVRQRILDTIASLKVEVDSNRLEQEMIFYMEKLDITEEKVRLENHCKYFREVADGEEGIGRKLGFIAQEMGREINTMGSKANNTDIQRLVVQMKDELEKIKEQVLNIL